MNALAPGTELHWYRIEEVLGQGGFGITYLAYDANLEQHVAIKEYLPMELAVREGDHSVYPASKAQDSRYRWGLDRFLSEARTLARFKHAAIVRVLSVFEENNIDSVHSQRFVVHPGKAAVLQHPDRLRL